MSTRTGDRILTSRAVYAAVFASTLEEMNSRMPFYQRVLHALAAGRRSMKVGVARRTRVRSTLCRPLQHLRGQEGQM